MEGSLFTSASPTGGAAAVNAVVSTEHGPLGQISKAPELPPPYLLHADRKSG